MSIVTRTKGEKKGQFVATFCNIDEQESSNETDHRKWKLNSQWKNHKSYLMISEEQYKTSRMGTSVSYSEVRYIGWGTKQNNFL